MATKTLALAVITAADTPRACPDFAPVSPLSDHSAKDDLRRSALTIEFHDRSPICAHAPSTYVGRKPSPLLLDELERISRDGVYQPQVLFIRNLGFREPTAARRISYQAFGYELIDIPAAPVHERAEAILGALAHIGTHTMRRQGPDPRTR